MEQLTFDQRWRDRNEIRLRPVHGADRPRMNPAEFGVEVLDGSRESEAKAFVLRHHYSGSWPGGSRCGVGLYRKRGVAPSELVGVAVFSNGGRNASRCYFDCEQREAAELSRFVLTDDVAYNGETWFLARALKALRAAKPEIGGIFSYSDPIEIRVPSTGKVVKPGHWGTIYSAGNATYVGTSRARTRFISRVTGTSFNERNINKILDGEQGIDYALKLLERLGAPARAPGEEVDAYVHRALQSDAFERVRHPGNFVYLFGLTHTARDLIKTRHVRLPYPKRDDATTARPVVNLTPRPAPVLALAAH